MNPEALRFLYFGNRASTGVIFESKTRARSGTANNVLVLLSITKANDDCRVVLVNALPRC